MKRYVCRTIPFLTGLLKLCALAPAAHAQEVPADTDNIQAYAKACYAWLEVQEADFNGPFKCEEGAFQLVTQVDQVVKDIFYPGRKLNPNREMPPGFPPVCDYPSWLAPGAASQCYGNSYIQEIKAKSNANVKAALLCRHKREWTDDPKKYPDIAMIMHNKKNGATCWFQTDDTAPHVADGTNVPAPQTAAATAFWLKPSQAANINCVQCHDNGAWMNSRWMFNAIDTLKDGHEKYLNSNATVQFGFEKWEDAKFVSVTRAGLPDMKGESCTRCHKISAALTPSYETFAHWLDYTIAVDPTKLAPQTDAFGKEFKNASWMPPDHGLGLDAYNTIYKNHIAKLRACMAAKGVGVIGCNTYVALYNLVPSGLAGARISASLDGGKTFPFLAVATPDPPDTSNPPNPVPAGSQLLMKWEADSSFYYCSIEGTFPAGVSTAGRNNWGLPESRNPSAR